MAASNGTNPLSQKVLYRPLEAAIRWSGLVRHESRILGLLVERTLSEIVDIPGWQILRLNTDRIFDALAHKELPCEVRGVGVTGDVPFDDPTLMIRHVALKAWMTRYYPDQRPPFLFSQAERQAHPVITVDAVNALVLEREAMKLQIEHAHRELASVRRSRAPGRQTESRANDGEGLRNETTYLHIVGGLLTLLLGRSPAGKPYSSFTSQEAIIDAIVAQHGGRLGITERTLQSKFAEAKRRLSAE